MKIVWKNSPIRQSKVLVGKRITPISPFQRCNKKQEGGTTNNQFPVPLQDAEVVQVSQSPPPPPPPPSSFREQPTKPSTSTNDDHKQQQQQQQQRQCKKVVRFPSRRACMHEMKEISRLSNMALDEIKSVWEDREEQVLRKQELRKQIQGFKLGRQHSDNETFSALGLGQYYGERKMEKRRVRNCVLDAVLGQQDLHRLHYDDDDFLDDGSEYRPTRIEELDYNERWDQIAEVYRETAAKAKAKAHQEATQLHLALHS